MSNDNSNYKNKLDSINNKFAILNKESGDHKSQLNKIKESFADLKNIFSKSFNQTITDLEFIINNSNKITNSENSDQKSKNVKNSSETTEEESPAAKKPLLIWPNDSYVYVHEKENKKHTFTVNTILESNFNIAIKVLKTSNSGYISIGLSDHVIDQEEGGWLGGDSGEVGQGCFGVSTNSAKGINGAWNVGGGGIIYKEGDVFHLSGSNGVISYTINDRDNSSFSHDMKTTNLYLAVSMYYKGDSLEILNA